MSFTVICSHLSSHQSSIKYPDHSYGSLVGWDKQPAEADHPKLPHFGSKTRQFIDSFCGKN